MVTGVRQLRGAFTDAGALHTRLAVCAFLDGGTFLTKGGAVGTAYRCTLPDDTCAGPEDLAAVSRRVAQGLRLLDPSFRVYFYIVSQPARLPRLRAHVRSVVQSAFERRAAHLAT